MRAPQCVALWTLPIRYFVALDKGWPVLLTDAKPLPWSAQIVSEHENSQEAADAFDELKRAFFKAQEGDGSVRD